MSNLLAALSTSGRALGVFQAALETVQNNIANASTPGYAAQRTGFEALPFDVVAGLAGGVTLQGLESSRDAFAEEQVRTQLHFEGRSLTQSQALSSIESLFTVSDSAGVPAALDDLLQAFSQWSVTPSSTTARDSVIFAASTMAGSVRAMSASLERATSDLDGQIDGAVTRINELAVSIQEYNRQVLTRQEADPGLDAGLNAALEELAEWIDFETVSQEDGQVTVVLSNGAPLVSGEQSFALEAGNALVTSPANPAAVPARAILDWQGREITPEITGGKLSGLLDVRNRVLGELQGGSSEEGSLNRFARALADQVNEILTTGYVSSETGAVHGVALFVYDSQNPTATAATLAVNPDIDAEELAPADSSGSNGAALKLAALGSAEAASLGGTSLIVFFAGITAGVGRERAASARSLDAQKEAVAQMRTLRDKISGVSLDEQAVLLLEFQRSYTAIARVISVLDEITEITVNLAR